jgi:hypothetical protein
MCMFQRLVLCECHKGYTHCVHIFTYTDLHYIQFIVPHKFHPNTIFGMGAHGGTVVEALRYKPEGCGINSRWCH